MQKVHNAGRHPVTRWNTVPLTSSVAVIALAAGFVPVLSVQAFAQSLAAPEEIVVTARGRAEVIQDVPDSVTAFTAADLEARQIRSANDVASITPGVFMVQDQDPGTNVISVRGITANRNQAGSIAFVVDGVALADTEFFTADLFGIERIEILKGPQGALYGKNAIGGVFNVVTKSPSDTLEGRFEAGYGNGDSYRLDGLVTGPLGSPKVRGLVAGSYRDTDGFIFNPTQNKPMDFFESANVRARVITDVTDALTVDLRGNWVKENGGASYFSLFDATHLTGGRLGKAAMVDPTSDYPNFSRREWWGASAKIDYAADFGTFTSISGYDHYTKFWLADVDFLPVAFLQPVGQPIRLEVYTQELRFTSPGTDRFRWIAGVFYQDTHREKEDLLSAVGSPNFLSITNAKQTAAFAQASFDVTDRLEVTAALRYDRDKRNEVLSLLDTGTLLRAASAKFDKWQPKVSVSYELAPQKMVYVTYAQGFKTGGFNPIPGPTDFFPGIYAPEATTSYEAGVKTQWLDGQLTVNAAAFTTDYKNKQEFALLPSLSQVTFNIPKVDVKGFEVQVAVRPAEGLSFDFGYGLTDAQMGTFLVTNFAGPQDYSGNKVPYTPSYNLNAGGQYQMALGVGDLTATLRADYYQVGKVRWEVDNTVYSPTHGWVDARLSVDSESWSLSLWGRNLTNKRWAVSAFSQNQVGALALLGGDAVATNVGRQYGVTASARF